LFVLLFVMGLVFQVPLVMTVTTRMGLVTPKTFRQKRKFFLLGAFVFAALLTPPDYVTQVLVATPMVVLFELGIFLSMLVARRAQQRRNEDSAEESTA
jgi:sec-independent protein translocase protein TatC